MKEHSLHSQSGISLVEVLVALSLFSFMALAMLRSNVHSIQTTTKNTYHSIATQLALDRLEDFSVIDPATLSDADDTSESVTRGNRQFTRVIDITVNTDRTREVEVTVTSDSPLIDASATVSNSYALWGSR